MLVGSHALGEAGSVLVVFFVTCFVFTLGYLLGLNSPVDTSVLVLLLLPMFWVVASPRVRICDGVIQRLCLVACAWMLWMALVQFVSPWALDCGWWRFAERAVGLSACLVVVMGGGDFRRRVELFGASAACAALVVVCMNASRDLLTHRQTLCFGVGHINIMVNLAGPALIAWTALVVGDWRRGIRSAVVPGVLLVVGWISFAVLAIATARRGSALALAIVLGWFALWALWRRWPMAAGAVVGLIVAGVALKVYRLSVLAVGTGLNERVSLYRAGWEGVREGFPLGYGQYGAMRLQEASGEAARHLTAAGGHGTHIHNEFLDVMLDGGPISLLLLLGAAGILMYRIHHIRDRVFRTVCEGLALAILTHAFTDNCYGTTIGVAWMGAAVGLVLSAPVASPGWRLLPWFPAPQFLLWPCALIAAWGAGHAASTGLIREDAGIAVRIAVLERAIEPQTVEMLSRQLLVDASADLSHQERRRIIDRCVSINGWNGFLAAQQAFWCMENGSPDQRVESILRVLRFNPFLGSAYLELGEVIVLHPDCARKVPSVVQTRCAYFKSLPGLPTPAFSEHPATIDEAADLYAAIAWSVTNGRPWTEIRKPLLGLAARYGNIPEVALMAMEIVSRAPPGEFQELARHADLFGAAMWALGHFLPALERIDSHDKAVAFLAVFSPLFQDVVDDFSQRRLSVRGELSGEWLRRRNAIIRICGLAARSQASSPVGGGVP